MRRAITHPLLVILLLFVTACTSTDLPPQYPMPRFNTQAPMRLDVSAVEVQEIYQSPGREPNVEHSFPIIPAQAVHQWAEDRFEAGGTNGVLRVEILDASVVRTALPTRQGIKGAFTNDQAERFDARLALQLKIFKDKLTPVATIEVKVSRNRTLAENASVEDRQQLYYELVRDLMNDLNRQAQPLVGRHFVQYSM